MPASDQNWKLTGHYFETCNCQVACPCVWLQEPSEGDCKLLVAWHIDNGFFQHIDLSNLNIALACFSKGNMIEGGWEAALYVDKRASETQYQALTTIFSGQAGGHLEILMSFVETIWGIKKVNIDYQYNNHEHRLSIPDIAEAQISPIKGISGTESTISNPPLCVVPSHPSVVARSLLYGYHDYGKQWNFSNSNGYYSEFDYSP